MNKKIKAAGLLNIGNLFRIQCKCQLRVILYKNRVLSPGHLLFYLILFYFLIFLMFNCFWKSGSRRGSEREGVTESKAGSGFWAVSTEPDARLEPTSHEIMTWAEVRCLTSWATQVPLILNIFFLVLLRNNWPTSLHKFKTYTMVVWLTYMVKWGYFENEINDTFKVLYILSDP